MAPKVLVSDKLSETAVQIFRDRGIEVDFDPSICKRQDAGRCHAPPQIPSTP